MKNTEMNIASVSNKEWFDFASICLAADKPLFTWGKAGSGKSDNMKQLVEMHGFDGIIDLRLAITDPSDVKGVPVPVKTDKGEVWVRWARDSRLPTDPDAKYLIILEELTSASPIVQGMAYQLVLDRGIADYVLPKGCRIMAAGNVKSDRGITNTMPGPLRNRFVHVELQPEVDVWAAWAVKNDILPEVVAFVRFKQDQLHHFEPEMTAFPTPRSLAMLSDLLKQKPSKSIETALIEGCCGRGFAIEFSGFLRMWRSLPDLKKVETSPMDVEVPTDPSTLYAVTGSLARMAKPQTMTNVVKYMQRLGREFQLIFANDIGAREDVTLVKNAAFHDMNTGIKNLLMEG
jgi:hypothetical protein